MAWHDALWMVARGVGRRLPACMEAPLGLRMLGCGNGTRGAVQAYPFMAVCRCVALYSPWPVWSRSPCGGGGSRVVCARSTCAGVAPVCCVQVPPVWHVWEPFCPVHAPLPARALEPVSVCRLRRECVEACSPAEVAPWYV